MLSLLTNTIQNHIQNNEKLNGFGVNISGWLALFTFVTIVAVLSVVAFYAFRLTILKLIDKTSKKRNNLLLRSCFKEGVFHRASFLIPGFIIYAALKSISYAQFPLADQIVFISSIIINVYMIVVITSIIFAFLNSINTRFKYLDISKNYSIKSFIQVGKIVFSTISTILVISALLNKSPMYFLTGLGAMTAVLLLVFKDSILGFVASIQLTAYDMVRIGDWIEMPNYGADGDVIDISLNTIKVKNFDKTIVTIPSYALLTSGVKNWRGMSESGGRRIKRAIHIDTNSIKFCSKEMLQQLAKLPVMQDRLKKNKRENPNKGTDDLVASMLGADDSCLTNVTALRIYIEEYLKNHPDVHNNMTFLIRELQAAGKGLPIEIYIFSSNNEWVPYEKIQADIFDYIYGVLPLFELQVFQYLSGSKLELSGK